MTRTIEDQVNDAYTYIRRSDGLKFRVTFLSHWSDIQAENGEQDSVKFYGSDGPGRELLVGHTGQTYIRISRCQHGDDFT